jgi:hypothetical protein
MMRERCNERGGGTMRETQQDRRHNKRGGSGMREVAA